MTAPATKTCQLPGCGGIITRQKGWSATKWDTRAYCNKSCAARDAKLRYPAPTETKRDNGQPTPPPPHMLPAAPTGPPRPVWRPTGWSATPNVGRPS